MTFKNTAEIPTWGPIAKLPIDTPRESMGLTSDGYTIYVPGGSGDNGNLNSIGTIPVGTHRLTLLIPRN